MYYVNVSNQTKIRKINEKIEEKEQMEKRNFYKQG